MYKAVGMVKEEIQKRDPTLEFSPSMFFSTGGGALLTALGEGVANLPLIKALIREEAVASPVKIPEQQGLVFSISSAVLNPVDPAPEETGGIDFGSKTMNIKYKFMGSFNGLDLKLPCLTQAQLDKIDIDSEIQQIKSMVSSGIYPSGRRIREFAAACMQKGKMSYYRDSLMFSVMDICKIEEENADDSSFELRQVMAILDLQV